MMYGEVAEFEKLAGQEFDFYGVDTLHFKLGETVWQAVEDESDGYRSYLGSIAPQTRDNLIFQTTPIARVRVEPFEESTIEGFRLVDAGDGHCWLTVGTDNSDDYYPCFVFGYEAKAPR